MAEDHSCRQGSGTHDAVRPRRLSPDDINSIEQSIQSIESEFSVAMGRADLVQTACADLQARLSAAFPGNGVQYLCRLAPLLGKRRGKVARPLFDFLADSVATVSEPWPILEGMLAIKDVGLAQRILAIAQKAVESSTLTVDLHIAEALASWVESDERLAASRVVLEAILVILQRLRLGESSDGETLGKIESIYLAHPAESGDTPSISSTLPAPSAPHPSRALRQLAARLLDLPERPVDSAIARRLLNAEAHAFLAPYIAYTRATHLDLLSLVPTSNASLPVMATLRCAEASLGEELLREIIGELRWPRLALGIEVRRFIGVSIAGSFPVLLTPAEASLFDSYEHARRVFDRFLVITHGGTIEEKPSSGTANGPVARFRAYNLTHSEVLGDILDVAELTCEKVQRILDRMSRIVKDYVALFSEHSDECAALPDIFARLCDRIRAELEKAVSGLPLSAELTRLVQMFEEPASLANVRTMHGLKRYLHQKGLRLGFRLVESGLATNRTVDMIVATPERLLHIARQMEYVDFEASGNETDPLHNQDGGATSESRPSALGLPYPVAVVVDGYGRQLLHNQPKLPSMKVFCYGNEVHYYASFGNHPAFIRIDYSPPHRGGMIDIEYFGVSKFQLDDHPAPELESIREFFRAMEFDIKVDQTRIHARYDKERALDMGDLCDKVERLFCLVPYLMEIDWVIGSLDLDESARKTVATAWADAFVRWDVLPLDQLLTKDRRGILLDIINSAAGPEEIRWVDTEPYRDRFSVSLPEDCLDWLGTTLKSQGLEAASPRKIAFARMFGQRVLDRLLLNPLRRAIRRGEIVESGTAPCLVGQSQELFQRRHSAACFAEILDPFDNTPSSNNCSGNKRMARCAALTTLIAPLERWLRFHTTGTLNGYEVQQASLMLCGGVISLYVLRDTDGIIRLAFFADGDSLFRRRDEIAEPWVENLLSSPADLELILRQNNYLTDARAETNQVRATIDEAAINNIRQRFALPNPTPVWKASPGDRLVKGLTASPGRAVGIAVLGMSSRSPEDLDGAVLFAPAVGPEADVFLYHSAAIVSTGGGVLSHAGLLAIQFKKPSLIIEGRWERSPTGESTLHYRVEEYAETEELIGNYRVSMRRNFKEREDSLREGDLVVVDADKGTLRVLGQNHDALALHDGLLQLNSLSDPFTQTTLDSSAVTDVFAIRARRLRALHSIEKILTRLRDPVLARHTVQELLLPNPLAEHRASRPEKTRLLGILLHGRNADVSEQAKSHMRDIASELANRQTSVCEEAERLLPVSQDLHEILSLRLKVLQLDDTLREVLALLATYEIDVETPPLRDTATIETIAHRSLHAFRDRLADTLRCEASQGDNLSGLRFKLHQMLRLDTLLDTPAKDCAMPDGLRIRLAEEDQRSLQRCSARRIIMPTDGAHELLSLVGSKAANLAAVGEVIGHDMIPPWFVVTDVALRDMMELPVPCKATGRTSINDSSTTLEKFITQTIHDTRLTDAQKSQRIAETWESVRLPHDLTEEIIAAYQSVIKPTGNAPALMSNDPAPESLDDSTQPFVAIRSSATEEDTEYATRAGEFDTFLFVRGENALLDYLKRAWSGLWTERAIHNRRVLGISPLEAGGGILVQRMVWSRVSGVLQTVNTAEGMLREMIINAGLGLGEGVVSGSVSADQVVVAKESIRENAPLSFRYSTADKREQVVFNKKRGHGTVCVETLYHQRLRPAMEYIELMELVHATSKLEAAYGYPLDIEFGIEQTQLRILQARPLAVFNSVLHETIASYPVV